MRTTMERTDTRVRSPDGVTWTFGSERIEPWPMPQAANPRAANDGGLTTRPCAFPPGTMAIITKPSRAPCAAGSARASDWVLGFEPRSAQLIEPLMGWCGGSDPLRHVELRFPTPEAAVRYAQRQGLRYELREPPRDRHARGGRSLKSRKWDAPCTGATRDESTITWMGCTWMGCGPRCGTPWSEGRGRGAGR